MFSRGRLGHSGLAGVRLGHSGLTGVRLGHSGLAGVGWATQV